MTDDLRDDWEEYIHMDPNKASEVFDPQLWWQSQNTPLAKHAQVCLKVLSLVFIPFFLLFIQELLGVPVSNGAVESIFSKAGVLDAKNRNTTRPLLRKAAIMMFCNGDVEDKHPQTRNLLCGCLGVGRFTAK